MFLYTTLKILYENKVISNKTFYKRSDILCIFEINRLIEKMTKLYFRTYRNYEDFNEILNRNMFVFIKVLVNRKIMSYPAFEDFLKKNSEYLEFI